MSFVLFFVFLAGVALYWYKNDGFFYFKTRHIEINLSSSGLNKISRANRSVKGKRRHRCRHCGTTVKKEGIECERCLNIHSENYSSSRFRETDKEVEVERTKKLTLRDKQRGNGK